jgi:protein-disulfide isomerase
MRPLFTGTVLALSLLAAGCGEGGGTKEAAGTGSLKAAPTPAPNGGEWTEVVSQTEQGGFLMGNPNAPVKVVEFASLTCGACGNFAATGAPELIDEYVKTGQVSFEIRNFVRDPADLAAALLSRCGGAGPYFQLTDQMFAAQEDWLGRLQNMSPALQQQLQTMPPERVAATLAEQAGLVQFVRVRGVPTEKANACLADQAALQKLVDMASAAQREHQITGTPTFLINNEVVEGATDWKTLEPRIRAALGA